MDIKINDDAMIGGDVNINQTIIERQKSLEEIKQDRMNRYRAKCREVYLDGRVEEYERTALDTLAAELHLTKDEARQIEDSEAAINKSRKTTLDKVSLVLLKQIVKKVRTADIEGAVKLFPKLRNMANSFDDEDVHFYYYMLLCVFNTNECIRLYESRSEDNYWQAYWTVMAYMKIGRLNSAETVKSNLSNWKEYEEENILLLEIATALLSDDPDTADALREVVEATYSPALQDFAEALFLIIMHEDIANSTYTICYIDGMFASITGRAGIGTIQPDGTLANGVVVSTKSDKTSKSADNNATEKKVQTKEKKIAMKDVVPKPFSKEECDRLVADDKICIQKMDDGLFMVTKKETDEESAAYGLWDRSNEYLILDVAYDEINWFEVNGETIYSFETYSEDKGFVCTNSMKRTIFDFDGWEHIKGDLIRIEKKDEYGRKVFGLIDFQSKTWVLDPIYKDWSTTFVDYDPEHLPIRNYFDKWGLFDYKEKKLVVECRYGNVELEGGKRYYYLVTNKNRVQDGWDVFVFGANVLYKRPLSGVGYHKIFDNILFLHKTNEGPYAICNTNRKDNQIVYYDDYLEKWYDDCIDENDITPLVFVKKDNKWGLLDAESGAMVLDLEYDDWGGDGIEGSPYYLFEKDGQTYTFNMFTRKFE